MNNPYSQQIPVDIFELPTLKKFGARISNRILNRSAVWLMGERITRSLLLKYLSLHENYHKIFGASQSNLIISLVECPLLGNEFNEYEFWKVALASIEELSAKTETPEEISKAYGLCQTNNFNISSVAKLLLILDKNKFHLVLLLDEFDYFMHLDGVNIGSFSGLGLQLRQLHFNYHLGVLISTHPSAFGTILQVSSPFYNMMLPEFLPSLEERDITFILNQPETPFTREDRKFILSISGRNLFLIRIAADTLWKEYEFFNTSGAFERYKNTGFKVHELTETYFSSVWKWWDSQTRQAVIAIALVQTPEITVKHKFSKTDLKKDILALEKAIKILSYEGVVSKSDESGEYQISQGALLWWLADELVRILNKDQSIEEWLYHREMKGGVLTQSQVDYLNSVSKSLTSLFEKGASILIEAYAKSIVG